MLAGHQFVVHVELVLDLLVLHDAFGAHHFLHLEAYRVAVLEYEGELGSHGDAPRLLQLDRVREELGPQRFVGDQIQQIPELERLHASSPRP